MTAIHKVHAPTDDEAVALLYEIVSIYSPSAQEQAIAERIVAALRAWGLAAEIDTAGNAVGHAGEGARTIVLLGHMDTVPGFPPVRLEGGLLYGRGAVDAKGPLAAMIVAAARAAASGRLGSLRVVVIGAVEEEAASSKGARHILASWPAPDFVIIGEPSGWDRIAVGYKGRLLIDYTLTKPVSHTAGQMRSACEEAVDFWLRLRAWAADYNQDKESLFAKLDPSLRHIHSETDGLMERVSMGIGLRLPIGFDVEAFKANAETWRSGAIVSMRGYEPAFRAEKRNALTSAFLAAIRAEGGIPAFLTKTGTSDMNVVGPHWACPIAAYGPGDSALDHTPDEHISLEEYLVSVRVLVRVLERLAAVNEKGP